MRHAIKYSALIVLLLAIVALLLVVIRHAVQSNARFPDWLSTLGIVSCWIALAVIYTRLGIWGGPFILRAGLVTTLLFLMVWYTLGQSRHEDVSFVEFLRIVASLGGFLSALLSVPIAIVEILTGKAKMDSSGNRRIGQVIDQPK